MSVGLVTERSEESKSSALEEVERASDGALCVTDCYMLEACKKVPPAIHALDGPEHILEPSASREIEVVHKLGTGIKNYEAQGVRRNSRIVPSRGINLPTKTTVTAPKVVLRAKSIIKPR